MKLTHTVYLLHKENALSYKFALLTPTGFSQLTVKIFMDDAFSEKSFPQEEIFRQAKI